MEEDEPELTLADVLAMERTDDSNVSKRFVIKGKPLNLTVSRKARASADEFCRLLELVTEGSVTRAMGGGTAPLLEMRMPPGGAMANKPIEVNGLSYFGQINVMGAITVKPAWLNNVRAWAIFGEQAGPEIMPVLDWACAEAGLTQHLAEKAATLAKNVSSAEE